MAVRRILVGVLVVVLLGAAAWIAIAWRRAIDPIEPRARASFDPVQVARGAKLAAAGDCNACHTAPAGRALAGGLALPTPFGTVYSTNITPDAETGIGRWSEAAFVRAMRDGIDREGDHLYPVFPYDHFRTVTDDDLRAIYAFLMSVEPVRATAPRNELAFPLGFRPLLAGWKALFLRDDLLARDASKGERWNRGAYLAEGLGHCGACHTPRNALGAERRDGRFAGGQAEGWIAPPLDPSSPAPVPWDADRLYAYLKHGLVPHQGIPAGPMLPVAHNLESLDPDDVRAIAEYVATTIGPPGEARRRRAEALVAQVAHEQQQGVGVRPAPPDADDATRAGREIYAAACATCHGAGRGTSSGSAINLALTTTLALAEPVNLIRVVDGGVVPRHGDRGRWMPAFRGAFTDDQLASLVVYLRAAYGPGAPWNGVEDAIRRVRDEDARRPRGRSEGGVE